MLCRKRTADCAHKVLLCFSAVLSATICCVYSRFGFELSGGRVQISVAIWKTNVVCCDAESMLAADILLHDDHLISSMRSADCGVCCLASQ